VKLVSTEKPRFKQYTSDYSCRGFLLVNGGISRYRIYFVSYLTVSISSATEISWLCNPHPRVFIQLGRTGRGKWHKELTRDSNFHSSGSRRHSASAHSPAAKGFQEGQCGRPHRSEGPTSLAHNCGVHFQG
jgi:hypothetical protein